MSSVYNPNSKTWSGVEIPIHSDDVMVGDLIFERFNEIPSNKVMQICADDDSAVTCEELKLNSIRVAQNLLKLGIQPDDVISLVSHQSHKSTFIIHACMFIGAIINPLHVLFDESDMSSLFQKTNPKIVICDSDGVDKCESVLKNANIDAKIYVTSSKVNSSKFPSVHELLMPTGDEDQFKPLKFTKKSDEKVLTIICSSGSSGPQKGICCSHFYSKNWIAMTKAIQAPTVTLNLSSLYWVTGFAPNALVTFKTNDLRIFTAETVHTLDEKSLIKMIRRYNVTDLQMPVPYMTKIMKSKNFLASEFESVKAFYVTGAIVPEVIRMKFSEVFPDKNFQIGYGLTEIIVSTTRPGEYKKKFSVGSMLFPNVHVKIVDEKGVSLENGHLGEIRAKTNFKFLGYYNNPEATKNAVDEENFFKTGDVGYFDENGLLFVKDRVKDIFEQDGCHINPSEIENIIESIDGVKQVSVVGVSDLKGTSYATAYAVVKKSNFEDLSEETIFDYVTTQLPKYKHLKAGVFFFDKLPAAPNGKILKRKVVEEIRLKENFQQR